MRVAFRRVEEQVADARASDVLLFGGHVGEDQAGGDALAAPFAGGAAEVGFAEFGEAEEPEVGFRGGGEDAQPGAEGCGVDLEGG